MAETRNVYFGGKHLLIGLALIAILRQPMVATFNIEGRYIIIERLALVNFRCFGPDPLTIDLISGLTAFVGVNGAGKTAVMQAHQRLFGITGDHRRLRRQDFQVLAAELVAPLQRTLVLEAVLPFPSSMPVAAPTPSLFPNSSSKWPPTRLAD